jgi:hypothetical protein
MIYGLLAGAVLLLHLFFVLFVAAGGFFVLRRPRLAWAHLPAAAWGIWIELSHSVCPLTPLENHLRRRAGDGGYEGGFIDHYIVSIVYPRGLTANAQLVIGGVLLLTTVAIYSKLLQRIRK